ncbi:zinc finger protein with KRAB and SCAN domains 1-like [Sceloporus undulatus]|uniref:zinc finger protein with KRAB and SCAN domains 1-like n=1 Tax=Sceloporus undulatus TaxID=8520 RepID=UPI001C4BD660|nr:zinc finger protein with KRAB and SCAN domains 1-like [Sceloporus undulatus]XP_042306573.1 zinc finger protein with KRAB and SCAN domains 1-like [Sceloporus undulatus]
MAGQPKWGVLQNRRGETFRTGEPCWENDKKDVRRTLQPIHTRGENPEMAETSQWDDTKAFLASFEKVAQACQWPREEWAARLLPALSGEAKEAYHALEIRDKEDYGKVKAAILQGDTWRMEMRRQHFREFRCQRVEDPQRIHSQVQELCHRWLKPERQSKDQILELLILEQFLASLPPDLQSWIRAGGPDTCSQAVALVEDFMMRMEEAGKGKKIQRPLREEGIEMLDAGEQPLNASNEQVCKETPKDSDMEVNLLGSGNKWPCHPSSSLLEQQGMVEAGLRKRAVNRKEASGVAWLVAAQTEVRPSPKTMFWEVQQENNRNVISLGDGKETQVKTGNPQLGIYKPGEISRPPPQKSQDDVMVKEEMKKQRCELDEQQRKQSMERKTECNELPNNHTATTIANFTTHTKEKMPLFSKYGRKYRYMSEFETILAIEAHSECPMSEGTFQQNSCLDETLKTLRGERRSEFAENEEEDIERQLRNREEEATTDSDQFGMRFSYAETLQINQGKQSEVKPYQCWQCGKHFKHRLSLRRHERIHTADKPFECPHCSKCFSHKRDFNRHELTHTREKPFQCSECGKKFCRKDHLVLHQRSHRRQKPSECL